MKALARRESKHCFAWHKSVPLERPLLKKFVFFFVIGCVVILTGPVDYISDGVSVAALRNGHEILGKFTGSGCIVGSSVATYCAAAVAVEKDADGTNGRLVSGDMFLAAIAG